MSHTLMPQLTKPFAMFQVQMTCFFLLITLSIGLSLIDTMSHIQLNMSRVLSTTQSTAQILLLLTILIANQEIYMPI